MKKYIIALAALCMTNMLSAQNEIQTKYRRSSLYQMMINHREQKYADEIQKVFLNMPVSEHFNDHDLSIKVVDMDKKLKGASSDRENAVVTQWLEDNKVASRLVAKWFDRDFYTGKCDMDLVKERGLYNASSFDKALANKSIRGTALLEDAGADLIGNTFVIINDIRYINNENKGKVAGGALRIGGGLLKAFTGVDLTSVTNVAASAVETLKGFKVKINTYLYQLNWNDTIADEFYATQYCVADNDPGRDVFEKNRGKYTLKFVGKQESSGSNNSILGVNLDTPDQMVHKACQRAVDENVANLQHNYEEFRTKSPLLTTNPLTVAIGLKEGITENSKFEVLEAVEKENGQIQYRKVGMIQPVKNLIWDNRYMAEEEGATNATLGCTTFKRISGSDFFPGMLVRETK